MQIDLSQEHRPRPLPPRKARLLLVCRYAAALLTGALIGLFAGRAYWANSADQGHIELAQVQVAPTDNGVEVNMNIVNFDLSTGQVSAVLADGKPQPVDSQALPGRTVTPVSARLDCKSSRPPQLMIITIDGLGGRHEAGYLPSKTEWVHACNRLTQK